MMSAGLTPDTRPTPLVTVDQFAYSVGDTLPVDCADVYHEAAAFSAHVMFDRILNEIDEPADIIQYPDIGHAFFLAATVRARSIGEFEPAKRFAIQSIGLARKVSQPFDAFLIYDGTRELAQLQAQVGDTAQAEKTLRAGLQALENRGPQGNKNAPAFTAEQREFYAERRYVGYLTLAALQGRQGQFAKALRMGHKALAIPPTVAEMRNSQTALETLLIPGLEDLQADRAASKQGLTPQEEESLWLPVEIKAGTAGFTFHHEIPLTPEERERFLYMADPHYLPTLEEAETAYKHDRQGELANRFYRSGRLGERYEIYTQEYMQALAQTLIGHVSTRPPLDSPLRILEVGAGEARLSGFLGQELQRQNCDVEVNACDINAAKVEQVFPIHKMDYREALARFNPHIVLSSWMPIRQNWTPDFRAQPDVQGYILVGPTDICATTGAWRGDPRSDFVGSELKAVNDLKAINHPYLPASAAIGTTTKAFWRQ